MKAATAKLDELQTEIDISIHAAREGGDNQHPPTARHLRISIHAAREGGDECTHQPIQVLIVFQSTPPVKAATWMLTRLGLKGKFQSTPPVKAATIYITSTGDYTCDFNPRRP